MFRSILDDILSKEKQEKAKEKLSAAFARTVIATAGAIETAGNIGVQLKGEFDKLADRVGRKVSELKQRGAEASPESTPAADKDEKKTARPAAKKAAKPE